LKIDLSGCPYGETTGPCSFIRRPANYYFFLAGLVKTQGLARILEIGTNYGGSIMSMSRGLPDQDIENSLLMTVDIVMKNDAGFAKYPHIKRIEGDSLDKKVAERVAGHFEGEIDMLYIDSVHEYEDTKKNIGIYAGMLNPKYVVLDDIRQSEGMRRLWNELKEEFGDDAFDASNISIRKGAGFGVIRWKKT